MPAATDSTAGPDAMGWDVVVVHRRGAPPLRFMGREVCRAEDGRAWVHIWQVRSGGFVLAHAVEDGQTADRYPSADAAMAALEAYCARLGAAADATAAPPRLDLADLLEEVARRTAWRQRFGALAGRALDRFDLWATWHLQRTKDRR